MEVAQDNVLLMSLHGLGLIAYMMKQLVRKCANPQKIGVIHLIIHLKSQTFTVSSLWVFSVYYRWITLGYELWLVDPSRQINCQWKHAALNKSCNAINNFRDIVKVRAPAQLLSNATLCAWNACQQLNNIKPCTSLSYLQLVTPPAC